MVGIDFKGLNREITTPATPTGQAFTSLLEKAAFDTRVAWRYQSSERRGRYARLGNVVLDALDAKITNLEHSVARFDWPAPGTLPGGQRLTAPANADQALQGRVTATVRTGEQAQRFYKFFSRGRSGSSLVGLEAGTYTFAVTQGGVTKQASVTLGQGATWADVLTGTARAINGLDLPVQAEILDQSGPYQNLDFLAKTGKILAVTVNPARAEQDVTLADTSGHLLARLNLEATSPAAGPAALQRHQVSTFSPARATLYATDQLNPAAATGLSAGIYKLRFSIGATTQTVSVGVTDGMNMRELLHATAGAINSTSGKLRATVREGTMASGLLDPATQRSVALEVTLADPKLGDRLTLAEYGGPWLDAVDGFHDPASGLPNWVMGGERYIATSTANGWTAGSIYEYDGSAWQETTPVTDNAVQSLATGQDFFFDGDSWEDTPQDGVLSELGLQAAVWPGADATAVVDGLGLSSESGLFSLDQGRVLLDVQGVGGAGDGVAISVVEGMGAVQDRLEDMLGAYNDLRAYILKNSDLLEAGFADQWREPVAAQSAELRWLGIGESPAARSLWVEHDTFWEAMGHDPDRAKAALYDAPSGLAPALAATAQNVRSPGLEERLVRPELVADIGPPVAREIANKQRTMLQEVIESASTAPPTAKSPYLETSGLLDRVQQAREVALAGAAALAEGGALLKSSA